MKQTKPLTFFPAFSSRHSFGKSHLAKARLPRAPELPPILGVRIMDLTWQ